MHRPFFCKTGILAKHLRLCFIKFQKILTKYKKINISI